MELRHLRYFVAVAEELHFTAFLTGLATAIGAGVSMAFSEGLSDIVVVAVAAG